MRVASILLVVVALASSARADAPPPPGIKRVSFQFQVLGMDRHPGVHLVAFPCTSPRPPIPEYLVLKDGGWVLIRDVDEGCTLYAVTPELLGEIQAAFPPIDRSAPQDCDDVKLTAMFERAARCDLRPSKVLSVPADDPRTDIRQSLEVVELNAKVCRLREVPVGTVLPAPAPVAAGAPDAAPTAVAAPDAAAAKAPAAASGGGGCAVGGGEAPLLGLLVGAWLLLRRRG